MGARMTHAWSCAVPSRRHIRHCRTVSQTNAAQRQSEITVLLVDDEPEVLSALGLIFRKEPYQVLLASSAVEAVRILQERDVHVVVSDEQMKGARGTELLRILAEDYPDTMRILLTGQATLRTAIEAINDGQVFRFVCKPCPGNKLREVVADVVRARHIPSSSESATRTIAESPRARRSSPGRPIA